MAANVNSSLTASLKMVPIIAMLMFLASDMIPMFKYPGRIHDDVSNDVMRIRRMPRIGYRPTSENRSGDLTMFGSPKYGRDYVIIYNAVPKCGSRTFLSSLNRMSTSYEHDISHVRSFGESWANIRSVVKAMNTPGFVTGHLPFLHFNRSDVLYINMIRNPLDRLISLYYFNVNGDEGGWKNRRFLKSMEGKRIESLEEMAARKGFQERQSYLSFFTQDDGVYRNNPDKAVRDAKKNIERNYVFIGLLEEFEASVEIYEKLFPDLMRGLTKEYQHIMKEQRWKYKTVDKAIPSNETLQNLMNNDIHLKYEFEIYEFVKQLFGKTKQRLLS